MPGRLVIFDIDGTLTDTNDIDDECYRATLTHKCGLDLAAIRWSEAPEVTDAALLEWLLKLQHHEPPSTQQLADIVRHFLKSLTLAHQSAPNRFAPIPGAEQVFNHLTGRGWRIAIATGGWEPCARFKLHAVRIPVEGVPMATASQARKRVGIIQLARQRAELQYGETFNQAVLVGDAPWDVRAAHELGWPLVLVTRTVPASRRHAACIPDYSNPSALARALDEANVPLAV